MLADRWLADPKFVRNEQAAYPVVNQVAIGLPWKVGARILKPLQNLQAPVICEGTQAAFERCV